MSQLPDGREQAWPMPLTGAALIQNLHLVAVGTAAKQLEQGQWCVNENETHSGLGNFARSFSLPFFLTYTAPLLLWSFCKKGERHIYVQWLQFNGKVRYFLWVDSIQSFLIKYPPHKYPRKEGFTPKLGTKSLKYKFNKTAYKSKPVKRVDEFVREDE